MSREAKVEESVVPTSYDELFRLYYSHVVRMVARAGVESANVEDVAMSILMKFIENDVLTDYDPTVVRSNGRQVQFINFLSGFVLAYVRGHVSSQWKHRQRNPISTDMPVGDTTTGAPSTWIEVYAEHREDDYRDLMEADFLLLVRAHLGSVSRVKQKPLLMLFDFMVLQVEQEERVQREELAALFDVSLSTLFRWLHVLRAEVNAVYARHISAV